MKTYNYHPETAEFVAASEADESPLESGVWLTPAHATALEPPLAGTDQAAIFKSGAWEIVADHRGKTYWIAGQQHQIDQLGAVPPAGSTPDKPPPTPAEASAERLGEIKAELASLTQAVQQHLDTKAQSLGYDDIRSAATYADEPAVAKFQNEGRALRAWRSLLWAAAYSKLQRVNAGLEPVPTKEMLIASLPVFTPP